MAYTLLELNVLLAEAELARHKLIIGKGEQSLSYDGKSVTYREADLYQLSAYITVLKNQIAKLDGSAPPRGPIHFSF